MPKYETKFRPGEKVRTPFGNEAIVQAIFIDRSDVSYYVKEATLDRCWLEKYLKPVPEEA